MVRLQLWTWLDFHTKNTLYCTDNVEKWGKEGRLGCWQATPILQCLQYTTYQLWETITPSFLLAYKSKGGKSRRVTNWRSIAFWPGGHCKGGWEDYTQLHSRNDFPPHLLLHVKYLHFLTQHPHFCYNLYKSFLTNCCSINQITWKGGRMSIQLCWS